MKLSYLNGNVSDVWVCQFRRRAPPVPGDVDTFSQGRRKLPKDFRDPSREKNWNTNVRVPASTTAPGATTVEGPASPARRKGGTTARTGDDSTEGAGAGRGDERRAKANAGEGGRKGVRWNTGKASLNKSENSAEKGFCGRCGRCKDCGRYVAHKSVVSFGLVIVVGMATVFSIVMRLGLRRAAKRWMYHVLSDANIFIFAI